MTTQPDPEPPARQPQQARANPNTLNNLFQKARVLKRMARTGITPNSPEGQEAVRDLAEAARQWRQSALDLAERLKAPYRTRPSFQRVPELPSREKLPARPEYRRNLLWWASRYAWDCADEKPTQESQNGLTITAVMGPMPRSQDNGEAGAA